MSRLAKCAAQQLNQNCKNTKGSLVPLCRAESDISQQLQLVEETTKAQIPMLCSDMKSIFEHISDSCPFHCNGPVLWSMHGSFHSVFHWDIGPPLLQAMYCQHLFQKKAKSYYDVVILLTFLLGLAACLIFCAEHPKPTPPPWSMGSGYAVHDIYLDFLI